MTNKLSINEEKFDKNPEKPAIEAVKPSIEFFTSHDYPELADYELNTRFNENRITALVRDPYWVYLYWEIHQLFEIHGQPVLKVLDITGKNYPHCPANDSFMIDINWEANDWYLKVPAANRTYTVELGIQQDSGFELIARSNYFSTPRDKPSDRYDPEWMTIDEIFNRSYRKPNSDGTFDTGSSPLGKEEQPGVGEYVSSPMMGPGAYVSSPIEQDEYISSPLTGDKFTN